MSDARSSRPSPIPEHLRTVTPRLVVPDGAAAIAFYRDAFAAEEIGERFSGPRGELIHAEVRIGDSVVMITEEGDDGALARSPQSLDGAASAIMATYWEDVDAAWARAIEAGAEVLFPLADQFYGDRAGRLRDPFGQQWMMSQRIELLSGEGNAPSGPALARGQTCVRETRGDQSFDERLWQGSVDGKCRELLVIA